MTPIAEDIDALAQAMLRTGYVPAAIQDEFHARVASGVLIRELHALGYVVTPLDTKTSPSIALRPPERHQRAAVAPVWPDANRECRLFRLA